MSNRDFYAILGVNRDATTELIRKAYKKQALKWHPDKNQNNLEESKSRFQDVSEAFSVLSNENKRKMYDQFGEAGLQEGGGVSPNNPFAGFRGAGGGVNFQFRGDPADIFKQFFNASSGFQTGGGVRFGFGEQEFRSRRRHRIQHHLNCTLEDLYCGCKKTMRVINGHPNYTSELKSFDIEVQPGWGHGTRAIFERVAHIPEPGIDIVFNINQLKHRIYTRKGSDLHTTVTLSLQQALVGINDSLPALDGRRIPLNTTARVVQPDSTMVIRGEGMPLSNASRLARPLMEVRRRGNLHVAFQVVFPNKKLSEEQKRLLAEALPSSL